VGFQSELFKTHRESRDVRAICREEIQTILKIEHDGAFGHSCFSLFQVDHCEGRSIIPNDQKRSVLRSAKVS